MTNINPSLTIDIISDVMCPWCFIGQKNLEAAMKIASEIPVMVRWRPFQLDPTLPDAGKDRQTYLNDKFGGPQKARELYTRIEEAGKAVGIEFRFDLIKLSPNTLKAHILIERAGKVSPTIQNRLVKQLFEQFFLHGANIADDAILTSAAMTAGFNEEAISKLEFTEDERRNVQDEIARTQAIGVSGVPFFILAEKYALSGAQPAQSLAQAMRQTWSEISAQ